MSLSKTKDFIIQQRSWIVFAIWVLVMVAFFVNTRSGYDDFYYYDSPYPELSDWHSPWGGMKFRFLHEVVEFFSLRYEFVGRSVVRCLVLGFLFASAAIFNGAIKRQGMRTRFFLLFLFLLPSFSFGLEPMSVRLADTNNLALTQLLLLLSILYYSFVVGIQSKVLFVTLFFFLCDTIAWRMQCLLYVPFLLWFLFYLYPFKMPFAKLHHIGLTVFLSGAIVAGQSFFYSHVLGAKKMSGETVMLLSDICSVENMVQINPKHEFVSQTRVWSPRLVYALPSNDSCSKPVIGQCFWYEINESSGEVLKPMVLKGTSCYYQYRQCFMDDIRQRWKELVIAYPREFLTFRLLCFSQLCLDREFALGVVPAIQSRYPHVQIHQSGIGTAQNSLAELYQCSQLSEFVSLMPSLATYTRLVRDTNVRGAIIRKLATPLRLALLLWLMMGSYLLFHKNRLGVSANLKVARLCYLLSLVHLVSLMPYTPTPDYRYMVTSLVFGYLSLGMYLTWICKKA